MIGAYFLSYSLASSTDRKYTLHRKPIVCVPDLFAIDANTKGKSGLDMQDYRRHDHHELNSYLPPQKLE